MAGALEGFVGPYAIEVPAQTAIVGFNFTGNAGQQVVKARLRVDRGVYGHLAAQRDACDLLQKAEWEGRGEGEAVLAVRSASGEVHIHGFFERGAGGDEREVNAGGQGGA